jgi:hypothetical protein
MAHEHSHTEPGQRDDPNSLSTFVIGIVGSILLFVIIVWLQAIFNEELEAERMAKQVLPRVESLDDFRARQQAVLHGYGWADPEARVVHIPIERAMELTVRELSGDRESSVTP